MRYNLIILYWKEYTMYTVKPVLKHRVGKTKLCSLKTCGLSQHNMTKSIKSVVKTWAFQDTMGLSLEWPFKTEYEAECI